jgi:hypothetical protein
LTVGLSVGERPLGRRIRSLIALAAAEHPPQCGRPLRREVCPLRCVNRIRQRSEIERRNGRGDFQ